MNVVGRKRREGVVNGIGEERGEKGSSGSGKSEARRRGFIHVDEDREF